MSHISIEKYEASFSLDKKKTANNTVNLKTISSLEILKSNIINLSRQLSSFKESESSFLDVLIPFDNYKLTTSFKTNKYIKVKVCCGNKDFFDKKINKNYNIIAGIIPTLKVSENIIKRFNIKTKLSKTLNIYHYYLEKCLELLSDKGEMILIIPQQFFNTTRGKELRQLFYNNGTITDIYSLDFIKNKYLELSEMVLIRYEKNNNSHKTCIHKNSKGQGRYYDETLSPEDTYFFKENENTERLGDYFDIKVGLVSGLNSVLCVSDNKNDSFKDYIINKEFTIDMITSSYYKTHKTDKYIFVDKYSLEDIKKDDKRLYDYLLRNKDKLNSRKTRKFTENNWWKWGAIRNLKQMMSGKDCIYVNYRTRVDEPFYTGKLTYFDGSVIALIPKSKKVDIKKWTKILNNSKDIFKKNHVYRGGCYYFTQQILSNLKIKI